ncbi:DUF5723 family protein [Xanthocytophaga flava]|uniref:DUF5723 family protein n=1 Tax=Xanthocytophaga flava TaxID=3048013 RepID=UPI0028D90082|nr:DUF5723 family protein [Xanthocytophaga flavus]MDJ1471323.1 DUF5723 family protein [Xanthocytophaga flavus]
MKSILLLVIILIFAHVTLWAQNEKSVFTTHAGAVNAFARDYQSIGINPANLGIKHTYKVAFSFGELGAGLGSRSLTQSQLNKFITAIDETPTSEERQSFVDAFANTNALNLTTDVTLWGFSIQIPKVGGFAVSNRQRVLTHIGLNKTFAEILFLGKDASIYQDPTFQDKVLGNEPIVSSAFSGSKLQIAAFNEWNLAYGITVLEQDDWKLAVGLGYKYIQGIGVLDFVAQDGKLRAYNAMSAVFGVDYGDLPTSDPNFTYVSEKGNFPFYKPAGTGHGFDIGLSADIGEKVKASLSVTDLGSIKWKNNLLQAQDQPLRPIQSDGMQTFNIFSQAATVLGDGMLTYQSGGTYTASLPTQLRAGIGFLPNEKLDLGADVALPLNDVAGNLPEYYAGVGIGYKPASFIRINTGVTSGAGYGVNVPAGINFDFGAYEFGFGTRSVNGWLTEKNPYVSALFGVLRFKIGKIENEE